MFNSIMKKYKGDVYQLCTWGSCKNCYFVDKGRAMRVIPCRDREFCHNHCKIDEKRNHWVKI